MILPRKVDEISLYDSFFNFLSPSSLTRATFTYNTHVNAIKEKIAVGPCLDVAVHASSSVVLVILRAAWFVLAFSAGHQPSLNFWE